MRRCRTVAGLALLVAVAGCTRPAPAPAPPAAGPPAHKRSILRENGFLEITIEAPDAPAGPKPAVVSYVDEFRTPLLERGMVVVTYALHWEYLRWLVPPPPPEAPPPATPVGKWLLASPSPQVIGKGYLELIDGNARNTMPDVLDAVAADPDVDPARLGIVGFSTNGFTALQAAAWNPRLRAVVAIAACGDYHRFLHESSLAMNGEPLDLAPDYDGWIRNVEPVRHPLRLVDAAVLMVNGRRDLPIPIACAESTARALRRAHTLVGDPARFRFVVVDEGHVMGARAQRETLAWLERWLGHRTSRRVH
jgi:pimeloyl-ACP methyl ester carboxylesterase